MPGSLPNHLSTVERSASPPPLPQDDDAISQTTQSTYVALDPSHGLSIAGFELPCYEPPPRGQRHGGRGGFAPTGGLKQAVIDPPGRRAGGLKTRNFKPIDEDEEEDCRGREEREGPKVVLGLFDNYQLESEDDENSRLEDLNEQALQALNEPEGNDNQDPQNEAKSTKAVSISKRSAKSGRSTTTKRSGRVVGVVGGGGGGGGDAISMRSGRSASARSVRSHATDVQSTVSTHYGRNLQEKIARAIYNPSQNVHGWGGIKRVERLFDQIDESKVGTGDRSNTASHSMNYREFSLAIKQIDPEIPHHEIVDLFNFYDRRHVGSVDVRVVRQGLVSVALQKRRERMFDSSTDAQQQQGGGNLLASASASAAGFGNSKDVYSLHRKLSDAVHVGNEAEIIDAFKDKFDENRGDRCIRKHQWINALKQHFAVGVLLSNRELKLLSNHYDNGDGYVNVSEFIHKLCKSQPSAEAVAKSPERSRSAGNRRKMRSASPPLPPQQTRPPNSAYLDTSATSLEGLMPMPRSPPKPVAQNHRSPNGLVAREQQDLPEPTTAVETMHEMDIQRSSQHQAPDECEGPPKPSNKYVQDRVTKEMCFSSDIPEGEIPYHPQRFTRLSITLDRIEGLPMNMINPPRMLEGCTNATTAVEGSQANFVFDEFRKPTPPMYSA